MLPGCLISYSPNEPVLYGLVLKSVMFKLAIKQSYNYGLNSQSARFRCAGFVGITIGVL